MSNEGTPNTQPSPGDYLRNIGPLAGMVVAAAALMLSAVAVVFFIALAAAIPCQYQAATFAIFTGVILAAFGVGLGGTAAIRSTVDKLGITATVGGGAAFLIIVMGAVLWATSGTCSTFVPNIKLTSIPRDRTIAKVDPQHHDAHLRVRIYHELRVEERPHDLAYNILLRRGSSPNLYVDLIRGDRSVLACSIVMNRPLPNQIERGLFKRNDIFPIVADDNVFNIQFQEEFVRDLVRSYAFKDRYTAADNSCIKVQVLDRQSGKPIWIPVREIYVVEPTLINRISHFAASGGSLSSFKSDFQLWAMQELGNTEPVDEPPPRPEVKPPAPVVAKPPTPTASKTQDPCPSSPAKVAAEGAFNLLSSQGIIGDDDLRSLYAGWCGVESKFYAVVKGQGEPNQKLQFVRFIRSSITTIDPCWSSSDSYRTRNSNALLAQCGRRLDRPRDWSRALPFASTQEQKAALVKLLAENNIALRREVESILRSYPHGEFRDILKAEYANASSSPPEFRQALASAAIGYHYNRIVEQAFAEQTQSARAASDIEIKAADYWLERLTGVDKATARARLHYAKAHVLLRQANEKPNPQERQEISENFSQITKLSPEEISAYPIPFHVARAFTFVRGSDNDRYRLAAANSGRFQSKGVRSVRVDSLTNEDRPKLYVVPDSESLSHATVSKNETVRLMINYEGAATTGGPSGSSVVWEFVSTPNSGYGWIQRRKPSS